MHYHNTAYHNTQKFAAKLCTKRWSDSPTSLITTLNWPSLCARRSRQKAQLCRRIIKNESIIPPSPYFSPPAFRNTRTQHAHVVRVPFARTTSFQSSFFISACHLWNRLPEHIISLPSSRSFKAALLKLPTFLPI